MAFAISVRRIIAGPANLGSHQRRFGNSDIRQLLSEKVLRPLGDPMNFEASDLAQINFVQIALEDFFL